MNNITKTPDEIPFYEKQQKPRRKSRVQISTFHQLCRRVAKNLKFPNRQIEVILTQFWQEALKDMLEGKKAQIGLGLISVTVHHRKAGYNPLSQARFKDRMVYRTKFQPNFALKKKLDALIGEEHYMAKYLRKMKEKQEADGGE
uniref:Putative DNA binding protein n=1 Tax=viral metagenome TaxID=1070528 RepID=A0A6H1ZAF9_9ZZZZ